MTLCISLEAVTSGDDEGSPSVQIGSCPVRRSGLSMRALPAEPPDWPRPLGDVDAFSVGSMLPSDVVLDWDPSRTLGVTLGDRGTALSIQGTHNGCSTSANARVTSM